MSQLTLPLGIRVHCMFCEHSVQAQEPQDAHDQMETHYGAEHADQIKRAIGGDVVVTKRGEVLVNRRSESAAAAWANGSLDQWLEERGVPRP